MEKLLAKFLKFIDGNRYLPVLFFLLIIDCIFILIHPFNRREIIFTDPKFSLTMDGGYAEIFQYLKFTLIVIWMGLLALRNRSLIYLSWSVVFAILLLDDSLSLHENIGKELSTILGFKPLFGLRSVDFGELLFYSFYGVLLVTLAAISYRRDRNQLARAASVRILILIAGLVVVSGFIDILHIMVETFFNIAATSRPGLLLEMLEDGGELLIVSCLTWLTYVTFKQRSLFPQLKITTTARIPTSSLQD